MRDQGIAFPDGNDRLLVLVARSDGRIAVTPDGQLPTLETNSSGQLELSSSGQISPRAAWTCTSAQHNETSNASTSSAQSDFTGLTQTRFTNEAVLIGPLGSWARNRGGVKDATTARVVAVDIAKTSQGPVRTVVLWIGLMPTSWHPPAPFRTVPIGYALSAQTLALNARRLLRAASRAGMLGYSTDLGVTQVQSDRQSKAERTASQFAWYEGSIPPALLPVSQVWGWLSDPYGRVLIMVDDNGAPSLPGGRPETEETWEQTLSREALEEANASIKTPVLMGYQHCREHQPDLVRRGLMQGRADTRGPEQREQHTEQAELTPAYAQVRLSAAFSDVGPQRPDPCSGQTYRRVLVPAPAANLLLCWGPEGDAQAATAALMGSTFSPGQEPAAVTPDPGRYVSELPARGWSPGQALLPPLTDT